MGAAVPRGRADRALPRHPMGPAASPVIDVRDLHVAYGRGRRRVEAVRGLTFFVRQGETVGFIGANGAGKSTTIKTLLGFTFPRSGQVRIFGEPAGSVASRRRIGYLPEVALYYPFMKARELLELYGGLHGLSRAELRRRIPCTLARVGLEGNGETLIRRSKGMQQRIGIAQALLSDPDLLILDELSAGLDPIGRYDLRQTLLDLKSRGRTLFFSSHELHEVEDLCDRVIIIDRGRKIADEPLSLILERVRQSGARSLEHYFMRLVRPEPALAQPAAA
jgi:ABC-2 type transport system ATP-binding protein